MRLLSNLHVKGKPAVLPDRAIRRQSHYFIYRPRISVAQCGKKEAEYVYCAVRPESLRVIQSSVGLSCRSAGDAVTDSSSLSTSHRNSIEMLPDSRTLPVIFGMNSQRIGQSS